MFRKEPKTTVYLYDTPIENIFLAEYMPEIPGDYLKVYLYAQMLASSGETAESPVYDAAAPAQSGAAGQAAGGLGLAGGSLAAGYRKIAKALRMEPVDVEKAFLYLSELGLAEKRAGRWVFPVMKEKLYGSPNTRRRTPENAGTGTAAGTPNGAAGAAQTGQPGAAGQSAQNGSLAGGADQTAYRRLLNNGPIADMTAKVQEIVGRFLLPEETQAIMDWITELGADPDLIVRAYEYARQRGATSHRYVSKVLIGWAENGIHTRQDADEYLAERDERHFVYRRIMQALGFSRNVTEEEARLIDEWVDELDCSMQQIMDACAKTAGIGNPNIKYVDAVLRNQKAGKGGQGGQSGQQEVSRNRVLAYYAHLREEAEERAEQARLDVYRRVPEIRQMDEQIAAASREMTNVMVQGGADKIERIQALRSRLQQTEQAKTRLMTERGIPIDIMNIRYRCPRCGDTGVLDNGARCDCYLEVVKEAADWHEEEK